MTLEMDSLEVFCFITSQPRWLVFRDICEQYNVRSKKRKESLWCGWKQERFLPEWMELELGLRLARTTWHLVK